MILSNFMFGENIDVYSKIVYMGLKKYVNKITGACFPSKKKLAEECGISVSTLNKAIKKLVDARVLEKDFRFRENKSQTSNLYTLTPFLTGGECYFKIREDIFKLGLQPKEVVVYSYLCSVANQDICYPSIKSISAACSLSETTVKGTIKDLISKKLIEKINQYREDGGKKNNLYKIVREEVIVDEVAEEASEAELIGQDQINDECEENFVEPIAHEKTSQLNNMRIVNENNIYSTINNMANKKIRKEIKKMKIRSDIFDFKLSENSFMIYLYINNCYDNDKPYFPSTDEIRQKLKISCENVKASLAELQIKGLVLKKDGNTPIDVSNTPPWAKKICP